jgi:hypothetical protein
MRTAISHNSSVWPGSRYLCVCALLASFFLILGSAQIQSAQTSAAAAPAAPQHKPIHPRKHTVAAKPQTPPPPVKAHIAVATPEPELPKWPANEKPVPAAITWDSHGLRVDAANSSLAQILSDVATATGTKVEGFDADERVFGAYGPGPARDVISQLLQGSGYNVLMVGDQGEGTPREIVLSSRSATTTPAANIPAPANSNDEDADTDESPTQPTPPPFRPGFGPGGQPRTPQQIQQQIQQRQQQGQPSANPQN